MIDTVRDIVQNWTGNYFQFIFNIWDYPDSNGNATGHFGSTYWLVLAVIFVCGIIWACTNVADHYSKDWKDGVRLGTMVIVPAFIWPWLVYIGFWALVFAGPVAFVIAWLDLLPSKEQRIKKKQQKVATLRAQKSEVMS